MHNLNINISTQGMYTVSFKADGNIHAVQINRPTRGKVFVYSQQENEAPVLLKEYPSHTVSNFYGNFFCNLGYTVIIVSEVEIYSAWEETLPVAPTVPGGDVAQAIINLQSQIAEQQGINENQQKEIERQKNYDQTQDENLNAATSIASAEAVRSLFNKKQA